MEKLKEYLIQMIDENTTIEEYNAKQILSPYLAGSYEFYKVCVLNTTFFLVKGLEDRTITQTKKQIQAIEEKMGERIVLWEDSLTPYKRKKYLADKVPFICEGNQMFLPFLGMHLDIKDRKEREEKNIEKFTPAMQLIFLRILYGGEKEWTQTELSKETKVTVMTVSRTLDTFVRYGLLEYSIAGQTRRKKTYLCKNKREYFENGKRYLMNPVKNIFYVKSIPDSIDVLSSGLSALGEKTMLDEPDYSIVAVYGAGTDTLKKEGISREEAYEEHLYEVQEMRYDISLFGKEHVIDPVSLIWSLKERDDRIEIAIDELMEEYEWYKE